MSIYNDAMTIIDSAISSALPDAAVKKALAEADFGGRTIHLVAIGKAAWQMANAAYEELGSRIADGMVITKYGHSNGSIGSLEIFEAGHPVPDENTYAATSAVVEKAGRWGENDAVLFLISGGGSALFEMPLISGEELQELTNQMLACGADIVEMNKIRKRLSAVKGGRFAELCAPAKVFSVILSDVLGDPVDMIASGPAYPDSSTCSDALAIVSKYSLTLSARALECLSRETPKQLDNVETYISGSVRQLCEAARKQCIALGYEPFILTDMLSCIAREAGSFLASIAKTYAGCGRSLAFIAGGETVVKLTGKGLGGRNQELALSAAAGIAGMENVAVFSVGSDGTDGPTDAAGGYVDGKTLSVLCENSISIDRVLAENDSYHALKKCGGLIITGNTGTNVNDLSVLLIRA